MIVEHPNMCVHGCLRVSGKIGTRMPDRGTRILSLVYTSYFRMKVDVNLTTVITANAGSTVENGNGYARFKRGPESMLRRVLIQDATVNLLEI